MEDQLESFDAEARVLALATSFDNFWPDFAGFVVLLMQLGFAFLEAGCVRFKNMQSIMIKVFLNTCITILCWWACGYAIAFGNTEDFIGRSHFANSGFRQTHHISHWSKKQIISSIIVFNTSVASAANSIVSGGACERMTIPGYAMISIFFSAFIYPVVIHWAYSGWLFDMGYHDLAGSGAIHFVGAIGALMITILLKPRLSRYDETQAHLFEPSNTPFIALATLSLYVCWLFFNAGSTFAITGEAGYIIGRAATNTMISGGAGGITVLFIHYYLNRDTPNQFSLVMICNGMLAGLVAVTGSCDVIEQWAAFVIGVLGGITYVGAAKACYILQFDDPVDALPIHGGCGFIGALFPGLFSIKNGAFYGFGGHQLGVQILGLVVWAAWSGGCHFIGLMIIKQIGLLNITEQEAELGIDFSQIGGPAYCYEILPPCDRDSQSLHGVHLIKQVDSHSPIKKQNTQQIELTGLKN